MSINVIWPHSCAVILENITSERLELPFLGRRGVNFNPGDKVAVLGNPLTQPSDPNKYDGKKSIKLLLQLIMEGKLAVLSIPGGDKEADNTSVPMIDDAMELLPGCRFEI